jgi:hypothetical protein
MVIWVTSGSIATAQITMWPYPNGHGTKDTSQKGQFHDICDWLQNQAKVAF